MQVAWQTRMRAEFFYLLFGVENLFLDRTPLFEVSPIDVFFDVCFGNIDFTLRDDLICNCALVSDLLLGDVVLN